eukprot:CAMPEP_0201547350 /NCGR_PEP_ID=MMETSP0173_2-20130828/3827_1 /ASSEMBLY_ACC=CAM_ASM_000268 /TAXON_ID=218659 /ORGANISM="Vexillifera sp., Strain DIVA3 564/2" /LENGTH=442 /DNA_ID=CAMNT_0047956377 /DNA_START=199 /DNA_END=1524 /DNA_ORIENTATION=+
MFRDWNSIDYLRLDKFYSLQRHFLQALFKLLQRQRWDNDALFQFSNFFAKHVFTSFNGPLGVTYHYIDIYLEELIKLPAFAQSKHVKKGAIASSSSSPPTTLKPRKTLVIAPEPFTLIIKPVLSLCAFTKLPKQVHPKVEKEFFKPLLKLLQKPADQQQIWLPETVIHYFLLIKALKRTLFQFASSSDIIEKNRDWLYERITQVQTLIEVYKTVLLAIVDGKKLTKDTKEFIDEHTKPSRQLFENDTSDSDDDDNYSSDISDDTSDSDDDDDYSSDSNDTSDSNDDDYSNDTSDSNDDNDNNNDSSSSSSDSNANIFSSSPPRQNNLHVERETNRSLFTKNKKRSSPSFQTVEMNSPSALKKQKVMHKKNVRWNLNANQYQEYIEHLMAKKKMPSLSAQPDRPILQPSGTFRTPQPRGGRTRNPRYRQKTPRRFANSRRRRS